MRRKGSHWFLLFAFLVCVFAKQEEDLYKILGVSRTATTKEIKQAYRRKALDTHPDKNKDIPSEQAAEAFHKVVGAFEILSDTTSRNRYDRTGRRQDQQSNGGGGGGGSSWSSWSFSWSSSSGSSGRSRSGSSQQRSNGQRRYQRQRLKDKFEVKEAQSRILHIVSLEQLETVIVDDDNDTLERNLLICFYTPKLEEHVMDEMVYPWPFAAMSTQGIWWEDLLQTTVVRYHRSNKLTEFFDIPSGDELKAPLFVFGRRGQKFDASSTNWSRLSTSDREVFDKWMWDQIKVEVEFVNHHDHPVEIYWIHGTSAKNSLKLEPGASAGHTTMLSHEWWVRDARVDTRKDSPGRWKLTKESMLISWKITSDEQHQQLVIPLRTCYDLSGHCAFWKQKGECQKNPVFMTGECALTCKKCTKDEESNSEGLGKDEL
jgi:curved DNA-binding protein CbpA